MVNLSSSRCLTLADHASRYQDGSIADVVELLGQTNHILTDMLWREGNLTSGHKTTVRTGLPKATWRKLNYGVPLSKSTTATITDTCGMLEVYSRIDAALADLEDDKEGFLLSENSAFIEGMSQQMASTLFYGNEKNEPAEFTGIIPRYNTLDVKKAASAVNVVDGGGTGSTNTSIILACWGPTTGFGIFPKGSTAGLKVRNVTTDAPVQDDNGDFYQAIQSHYKWDCGLTIRDWRYFVRIANIDVQALNTEKAANLLTLMLAAMGKPPTLPAAASNIQSYENGNNGTMNAKLSFGRPAFYCNRTIATALRNQAMNKQNVLLTLDQFAGMPITRFSGIPIQVSDALLETEEQVI